MDYRIYESYYARVPSHAYAPAPMTTSTPAAAEGENTPAVYTALRIFGLVVLVLMLVSIVYAGWIALENWGSIRV